MIAEKKYFSIAEVAELTGLSAHKLRYVEKSDQNLSIIKMRGRRYYTKDSINYLKQSYSINLIADTDSEVKLAKEDAIQAENSFLSVTPSYREILPHQLDLGIKSFTKKIHEDFSLHGVNTNANQPAEATAQIFTEI